VLGASIVAVVILAVVILAPVNDAGNAAEAAESAAEAAESAAKAAESAAKAAGSAALIVAVFTLVYSIAQLNSPPSEDWVALYRLEGRIRIEPEDSLEWRRVESDIEAELKR